jgi:hypothetical protein
LGEILSYEGSPDPLDREIKRLVRLHKLIGFAAMVVGPLFFLIGFSETINDNPGRMDSLILLGGMIGGVFTTALGVLTIRSGIMISLRRERKFSMTVAALNCLFIPIGTILGPYTLRAMCRKEMLERYRVDNNVADADPEPVKRTSK